MIDLDVLSKADVAADGQPKFWRSQADRDGAAGHAAITKDEFLPGMTDRSELDADPGPSRRSFMKIMGASMALAGVGLSGCRRPREAVLPYARKPEEVVPGVPNFYATAMPAGGYVEPLLVESHEGRPTKVEGNPEHPMSRGASSLYAQASILNLYDPDRSRRIRRREGGAATRADLATALRGLTSGSRLVVLSEPTSSPTAQRLRDQLTQRFGNAEWITYRSFGDAPGGRPLYRFSQAQTIVSFDADFLSGENALFNAREYAESRRVMEPGDEMSRLYVVESAYTTTGGMADHRLPLKAGHIPFFAAAVAAALGQGGAPAGARTFADHPIVRAIAEDARAGATVFVAGPTQPAAVHALCARLNAQFAAGAVEYLVTGDEPEAPQAQTMQQLAQRMRTGQVDALVMIGVNPGYDAPVGLDFAAAVQQVPLSLHLGPHVDETGRLASWHVPRAHYLEQWGDGRAYDGTYSVIQPLIAPLYEDALSEIELLNLLATGQETSGYDLVRTTVREQGLVGGNFEDGWRTLLHDGFLPDSGFATGAAPAAAAGSSLAALRAPADDALEVVIRPDPKMLDGAFSNNAWMQELPDPVTKVTWDAVAQMSARTAERLGIEVVEGSYEGGAVEAGRVYADVVTIRVGGQAIELPVWIQPGHPHDSITVTTGYGRELDTDRLIRDRNLLARLFDKDTDVYRPGPVANGIGANANAALLRGPDGLNVIPAAEVEVTGSGYMIATTQDHGSMEGRPIVRMATLDEFNSEEGFARNAVKPIGGVPWETYPPLWGEENTPQADPVIGEAMYSDNQWGMTIDLNACSGCNACVVACQSENNVIVVGKDQVARGREMHWLRMDRYYVTERDYRVPGTTGDAVEVNEGEDYDAPGMVMQPMFCQHCENAPCEQVCPVAATSHSPDGINEMTYNRCIGTRYCSNNCPYKVRRFNFYNWTNNLPLEVQMAMNPDVTVRFRGVMEKCTFCVQRVRAAQRVAHIENRKVRDGDVVTACQQVCPTDAIVFGDLTDPDSRVSQMKRNARRYELLEELAVRPRLSYLARLRNPSPLLAGGTPTPVQPTPPRESVPEPAAEPVVPEA